MNDWQVVPRRRTIDGVKFRLHGKKGNKLNVYIGSGLKKRLKGYRPDSYCNIYSKGDNLMVQVVCVSDSNSRKLRGSVFSLPYSLVEAYWKDGAREIEIPAVVEKGNLILLDLRDLSK